MIKNRQGLLNVMLATAFLNKSNKEAEINPFDGVDVDLEFEPLYEWVSCGNTNQRSRTTYKNVEIIHTNVSYWNLLKKPSDTFVLSLCLPFDTKVEGGYMFNYYEPEGFGCPNFYMLKDVIKFIDEHPELIENKLN